MLTLDLFYTVLHPQRVVRKHAVVYSLVLFTIKFHMHFHYYLENNFLNNRVIKLKKIWLIFSGKVSRIMVHKFWNIVRSDPILHHAEFVDECPAMISIK